MSEIKTNEVTVVDADFVDDFESPAESHPMAAYHFKQAAEKISPFIDFIYLSKMN